MIMSYLFWEDRIKIDPIGQIGGDRMALSRPRTSTQRKEAFDWEKFARIYPNSNGSARLCTCPMEGDEERYRKLYEEDDTVLTVAEFAAKLDSDDETA